MLVDVRFFPSFHSNSDNHRIGCRPGGSGNGAAALLFPAVAELLVEAYLIKKSTGTIAMAAAGFLLFLILMMLM